ncbi:MAG: ParB N-terminal domain-containing protein [Anaeromyxobacter sp.]|nr:ParB N-terminal domain-containing protein [Anaeromyxobacter sp.]MBL0276508.1 ParB N-terminal domain-containing protein [Anaeromyxobacter sp.]
MELVPRTTAPLHATGAVEFIPLEAIAADATFRLREVGDVALLAGSIARLGQLGPVELRPLAGAAEDDPAQFQVVAGFRRLAAVRLLGRTRVLARVHDRLDDEDAWALALVQALLGEPLGEPELSALARRLAEGHLAPWAEGLLEEARVRAPVAPEQREAFLAFLEGAPAALSGAGAPGDDGGATEDAASDEAADRDLEPAADPWDPGLDADAAAAPAGPAAPAATPADAAPQEVTPEELAADLAGRLWQLNQDLSLAVDAWDELPEDARRMIVEQARYLAELYPYLTGGRR